MRNQRRVVMAMLFGTVLAGGVLAACGDDGGSSSSDGDASDTTDAPDTMGDAMATDAVRVVEFSFEPGDIEVAAGSEVTWTNEDDFDHQVTVRDGGFESDAFGGDESVSTTFADPGTYEYFCGIHNSMTGTVTVT